ncbi:hypothetical protein Hanom_Chr08g00740121 [Helianthus anomalus]
MGFFSLERSVFNAKESTRKMTNQTDDYETFNSLKIQISNTKWVKSLGVFIM